MQRGASTTRRAASRTRTAAQRRIETAIDTELRTLRQTSRQQKTIAARLERLRAQLAQALSEMQNAENVRSQAEKRLETQRKDLTRNWGG